MAQAEFRAPWTNIPASGLKKHDRLEPWTGLQDIGDEFDQLQPTAARPVRVFFWRRSEETATRRRSPLLNTGLHTSVNSLTINMWFLGIHQKVSRLGLVESARSNLFQLRVASAEALIQKGIIRLRTSLFLFYRLYHEENPAEEFSTLGDLSEKTLGQRSASQNLRCKGAENRMRVPFSVWLFKGHPGVVPQEDIMLMGLEALEGMANTVRAAPTNRGNAEMQMVHDLKRHFRAMDLLDISRVPKHHLCTHWIHNIPLHGNPQTYVLFLDEAFNGKLKKIAAACHRTVFHKRVLAEFCILEGRGVDRLKRRRAL